LPHLTDMTRADLEKAVRIYLDEAYGEVGPPDRVRERLAAWPEGETLAEVAVGEAFERTPPDVPPPQCTHLRLRLGNPRFPHMKLGLDRVAETGDWVLTVDCHDARLLQVASEAERDAVAAIIRANADLKRRIERRWTDAGLPTFEQYVRSRLPGRRTAGGLGCDED